MKPVAVAFGAHEHAPPLRWTRDLAKALGAPLRVLSVVAPTSAEAPPEYFEELDEQRRTQIASALSEAGINDAEIVLMNEHKPLGAVAAYADEHDLAACIVGSPQEGGLGEGNPANYLLHHTHIPIAMVGNEYEPLDGGVFVVGVEATGTVSPALRMASDLASATGGSLHAVHAYESISEDEAERFREMEASLSSQVSVPLQFVPLAGHPAGVVIDHAEEAGAAAIVIGTRGSGGFLGLRLGRVPSQLLNHAACPVIVVPHSDDAA